MWKVYKHTTPSGKVYIGITSASAKRRWNNGNGYKSCVLFNRAIEKYGWENISHQILWDNLDEETAKAIEMTLIAYYKELGMSYNITDGGNGTLGWKPSKEWRKKHSDRMKVCQFGDNNPNYGKHYSVKEKMKIGAKGIIQYDLDGNFIKEWPNIADTERFFVGKRTNNIGRAIRSNSSAYGYKWKYKD